MTRSAVKSINTNVNKSKENNNKYAYTFILSLLQTNKVCYCDNAVITQYDSAKQFIHQKEFSLILQHPKGVLSV